MNSSRAESNTTTPMNSGSFAESACVTSICAPLAPPTSTVAPVARSTGGSRLSRRFCTMSVVAWSCGAERGYTV